MGTTSTGRRATARKLAVGVVTGGLVVGGAGVGFAGWGVSATGSSAAKSATPVVGTVTAAAPVAELYPGASSPVYFTVTNPNSFPVVYTGLSLGTITSDDAMACPGTNLTINAMTISVSLAAGQTSTVQSPAGAVTMSSGAPVGCQGRTFTIDATVSGESA